MVEMLIIFVLLFFLGDEGDQEEGDQEEFK
eukprot:SAG11_NODE_188_length_13029_cov_3.652514_3_plen_30_part_00